MRILCAETVVGGDALFSHLGQLKVLPEKQINQQALSQSDMLITRSSLKVTPELLIDTPVKTVATATSGIDHIDIDFLNQQGIHFYSATGANAVSVAEYVIAALLQLASQKQISLVGKTMGIVGYGEVGRQVANYAHLLGLHILVNDPPLQARYATALASVTAVSLPELLQQADIVSLHPCLEQSGLWPSYHLADNAFFAAMKTGAWLLNAARGAVVDTVALLAAIDQDKLDAVIIDVWEDEPYYAVVLLNKADIATPHIAGYSYTARLRGTYQVYTQICQQLGVNASKPWSDMMRQAGLIELDNRDINHQQALHVCLSQVYAVNKDDAMLRATADGIEEQRANSFSQLRLNYPIRWECSAYRVKLSQPDKHLAKTLQRFGFTVE